MHRKYLRDVVFCYVLWSLNLSSAQMTSGQFHLLEDTQRIYSEAVRHFRAIGYDGLAVISSKNMFQSVLEKLKYPKVEQYWIGMHYSVKKHAHVWDTGVDITWAAWYSGEPNDLPRDKCVRIRTTLNFGTLNCTANCMAVCGYYSPKYNEFDVKVIKQIPSAYPLWSGTSRSMLDCVTHCMTDVKCQHIVYDERGQYCVTLPNVYDVTSGSQTVTDGVLVSKEDADFF